MSNSYIGILILSCLVILDILIVIYLFGQHYFKKVKNATTI
jgi:hypothetical protein